MSTFYKNNEGGIAIPFLCLLALFTINTLYFIDDYKQKQLLMKQATDSYLADILEEKSQADILIMENNETKIVNYSVGQVTLEKSRFGSLVKLKIELHSGFKRHVFVNN